MVWGATSIWPDCAHPNVVLYFVAESINMCEGDHHLARMRTLLTPVYTLRQTVSIVFATLAHNKTTPSGRHQNRAQSQRFRIILPTPSCVCHPCNTQKRQLPSGRHQHTAQSLWFRIILLTPICVCHPCNTHKGNNPLEGTNTVPRAYGSGYFCQAPSVFATLQHPPWYQEH